MQVVFPIILHIDYVFHQKVFPQHFFHLESLSNRSIFIALPQSSPNQTLLPPSCNEPPKSTTHAFLKE